MNNVSPILDLAASLIQSAYRCPPVTCKQLPPFFSPGSMVMLRHTQDVQQVQAPAFVGELVILAPTWQHARCVTVKVRKPTPST